PLGRRGAYRMRRYAPAGTVQCLHDGFVLLRGICLQTAIFTTMSPRFFVGFAHPSAFETAVDAQLDSNGTDPFVTVILFHTEPIKHLLDVVGRPTRAEQYVNAHREHTAALHFLERVPHFERSSGIADAGQADGMEPSEFRRQVVDLLLGADRRCRRQADKVLRFIDKLAVQLSVGTTADTAALRGRRSFPDAPPRKGSRIQDLFVPDAHQATRG